MKPCCKSALVIVPLLFFTGCWVVSLRALFTEDEYVAVPGIVGTWETEEETWVFRDPPESAAYTLLLTSKETTSEFLVAFGRIGGELYLDMSPLEPETRSEVLKRHRVLAHTFYKVELADAEFRCTPMDLDWLDQKISDGEISIEHFETEFGGIALTADTEALQALVRAHSAEMFSDVQTLKKRIPQ